MKCPNFVPFVWRQVRAWLIVAVMCGLLAGCNESDTSAAANGQGASSPIVQGASRVEASNPKAVGPQTAQSVLSAMVAAYQQARTYQDGGIIEFQLATGDDPVEVSKLDFSVSFERPNKLRMHVNRGILVSDGKQLRGLVTEMTDQVLAQEAPTELTIDDIYADEVLGTFLAQGPAGASLQVLLLLDKEPLEKIFLGAQTPELIEPATIEDRLCERVRAVRPDGQLVLWIDQQTHELRRVDFPIDELRKSLESQFKVKSLAVWADFKGARLGGKISPAAFEFESPAGAKLVKQLEVPKQDLPPPPAPSPLLGKPAREFAFAGLDGKPVSKASLSGKVAVLDFWFTTCPPCRESLPNLQLAYEKYKDHPQVRFVAVSVDPAQVKDEDLSEMFGKLGVHVPIARDVEMSVRDSFGVEGFPTMFVLGPDGTVQHHEIGFNPALAQTLPDHIERLLKGEDVYPLTIKEYERKLQEHEQAKKQQEVPRAAIAPKSEPQALRLTKLWSNQELEQPGNFLIVPGSPNPRILINDGWRHVAEISADGKVIARHELKIPADDVVSVLRLAQDVNGRRYAVGFASSQKQCHLFDEQWNLVWSYPPDRDHAGIADVQVGDLEGDGTPEFLVSYWGVVGIQAVSLEGKRLWSNRSMEHVFRVAVDEPDRAGHRQVLCANAQGNLVPVNHEGSHGQPIVVPDQYIHFIAAQPLVSKGQHELLALLAAKGGSEMAAGLNRKGEVLWTYPLPAGVPQYPIELVTSGAFLGDTEQQWLVAGVDGSLNFLQADGQPIDRFHYGSALCGVASVKLGGKPALLVATPQGVDAWQIGQP